MLARQDIACRNDVPSGVVPEYKEFLRRVWAWQEEDAVLDAPPWMYSVIIEDPDEARVVSLLVGLLYQIDGLGDRFENIVVENGSEFSFADLEALHMFLRSCASCGATDETARRICEYIMWTLGFRWV